MVACANWSRRRPARPCCTAAFAGTDRRRVAAADYYRRAIAVDPNFMEAHVDRQACCGVWGDFEGSLRHAQEAVRIYPDHPYAPWRILGTALLT